MRKTLIMAAVALVIATPALAEDWDFVLVNNTGKEIKEGAYSDILSVGDEAIWSITNGAMTVRHKNLIIMVILPDDKRTQAAVATKILGQL